MFRDLLSEKKPLIEKHIAARISTPSRFYLWVLLWVMIAGFSAYLFQWTSTAYSHDSLLIYQFPGFENIPAYLNNGRFLTPLYLMVRGGISAPLLIGILGTLFLSMAIALMLWLLDLKGRLLSAALAGVLAVNASITLLNATYIKDYDVYMLALLLCVIGVYLVKRFKYGYLSGAVCFMVSLGLYQAYVQFALVLVLLVMLKMLLEGATNKDVLRTGVRSAVSFLFALLLYALVLVVLVKLFDFHFDDGYNSLATKAPVSIISVEFAKMLLRAYAWPFKYLLLPETHANVLVGALNLILFALSVTMLIRIFRTRKMKGSAIFFSVALLLLMPIAASCIYPFSANVFHGLTIYAYHAFYLLPAVLFCVVLEADAGGSMGSDSIKGGVTRSHQGKAVGSCLIAFLVGSCCVVSLNNIVYANQVSLEKNLVYEATVSVMTRIADTMDETEGYSPGETPVVFVGFLKDNPLFEGARPHYSMKKIASGVLYGTGLWHDIGLTNASTYSMFFRYILGLPINQVSAPLDSSQALEAELDEMPAYPHPGYSKMVDGVLYVKLS